MFFFLPEDEDVEHGQVERQPQDKLHDHQPGQRLVGDLTGHMAVVDGIIDRHIHLVVHDDCSTRR